MLLSAAFVAAQTPADTAIRAVSLYEPCVASPGAADSIAALIAGLKGKEAAKRSKAATSLARTCDARAIEPLAAALKDPEAGVRVAAVEALGQIGDRAAIDPLIEAIADEDWHVRLALARTLCSFQTYPSNNAALNALTNPGEKKITDEDDLRVRCMGILMVNQLRDVRFSRKAIGFLFLFLDYDDAKLRGIAEQTAMELKNTRNGMRELIAILKQHSYPDFRRKAAYWLGRYRLEEARGALEEASIADRDSSVQRVAKEALGEMNKK
jgi:HEAT repeat protein